MNDVRGRRGGFIARGRHSPNAKPDEVRRSLKSVLKNVRIGPTSWYVVRAYADLRLFAKTNGIAISHVDLVLAGLAQNAGAILLTTDNDFRDLKTIRTENWTAAP